MGVLEREGSKSGRRRALEVLEADDCCRPLRLVQRASDSKAHHRTRLAFVFVNGVLYTLSAWVMVLSLPWSGLEPGRKLPLPLGLLLR